MDAYVLAFNALHPSSSYMKVFYTRYIVPKKFYSFCVRLCLNTSLSLLFEVAQTAKREHARQPDPVWLFWQSVVVGFENTYNEALTELSSMRPRDCPLPCAVALAWCALRGARVVALKALPVEDSILALESVGCSAPATARVLFSPRSICQHW